MDRSGQHWTPVALWTLNSVCSRLHVKRQDETSKGSRKKTIAKKKKIGYNQCCKEIGKKLIIQF